MDTYQRLKKDVPGFLFYISNKFNSEIVVYRAHRDGNTLTEPLVSYYGLDLATKQEVDIPKGIGDIVFHTESSSTDSKAKYLSIISALPEQVFTLHLRKKKPGQHTGEVLAKTMVPNKEETIELEVQHITVEQTSSVTLPTGIQIHGLVKRNGGKELYKTFLTCNSDLLSQLRSFTIQQALGLQTKAKSS